MYWFLFEQFGEPGRSMRRGFRFQIICWGLAGLTAFVTLLLGITSGREYLGFHPVVALLILAGWVSFAWTFVSRVAPGFFGRPVYVYMWSTGALLFILAFLEGHAHMLSSVGSQPIADLHIQWKSCGSLVASFNQMVYGSMMYVGERASGDRRIAQSRPAFGLLAVGLLNSFTNYGHHTYHVPQDPTIKWISFVVSMLEVIILAVLLRDVTRAMRKPRVSSMDFDAPSRLMGLAQGWNLFLLPIAILISIPSLNGLIHGTHVVMAHAMGSAIAIDTYILLGVFAWLLATLYPKREVLQTVIHTPDVRRSILLLNASLIALVGALLVGGVTEGLTHYLGEPKPEWMGYFPFVFVTCGLGVGYALVSLIACWSPLFRDPVRHKLLRHDPRWSRLTDAASADRPRRAE